MPFVNVVILPANLGVGTQTDDDGKFSLTGNVRGESVLFSFVGYEAVTIPLSEISNEPLNIKKTPSHLEMGELVITARRTRYSNRDNPAVELMRRVIDNKDNNRITAHQTYEFERYEKIQLSLNDLNENLQDRRIFQTFPFLLNHIDTAEHTGQL